MRVLAVAAAFLLAGTSACFAADASCDARAKEKKLAGAALKSFMTKCETDSMDKCAVEAKSKKLHGAAETSFTKKCVKDAVGQG